MTINFISDATFKPIAKETLNITQAVGTIGIKTILHKTLSAELIVAEIRCEKQIHFVNMVGFPAANGTGTFEVKFRSIEAANEVRSSYIDKKKKGENPPTF